MKIHVKIKPNAIAAAAILAAAACTSDVPSSIGSIHGIVKDYETSAPIGGCEVSLLPTGQTSVTGSDGSYQFENLAPGIYTVSAGSAGYASNSKSAQVTAGVGAPVDIVLTKVSPTGIYGVVKSAATGLAVPNCEVQLLPGGETQTTDNDGVFQFTGIAARAYDVEVKAINVGYNNAKKSVIVRTGEQSVLHFMLLAFDPNNRLAELGATSVSEVSYNAALVQSEVLNIGSSSVTDRGFLYSEQMNPIFDNGAQRKQAGGGAGQFEARLTQLSPQTDYYVVPYAVNARGTQYGEQRTFRTGDPSSVTAPPNVIYVSVSGNDANDGSSWSKAKKTIKAAVDIATGSKQIWVSAGTFNERLYTRDTIHIYGGFRGTETAIDQRTERTTVSYIDTYTDLTYTGEYGDQITEYLIYTKPTIINGFTMEYVRIKKYIHLENCEMKNSQLTIALIEASGTNNVMKNCTISDNVTDKLFRGNGKIKLVNCNIRGNAQWWSSEASIVDEMYGCVVANNAYPISGAHNSNCTFANNSSAPPYSGNSYSYYNCIVWNNGASSIGEFNNKVVTNGNNTTIKFKNPSTAKGSEAADRHTADWSLTSGSECIDAGTSVFYPKDDYPTDIAGSDRIIGNAIDIGAYEY